MSRRSSALLLAGAAVALSLAFLLPRLEKQLDRFSVALDLIADGRGGEAVHLFDDQIWRGIAEFRANRYRRATAEFIRDESVTSLYNLGTAYARLGEWSAARAAYEKTLSVDPGHEDAAYNLALVVQAEARQQQEQEEQQQTRTLGTEKGETGSSSEDGSPEGDKTTTEDARPSDAATPSDEPADQAGQIAAQGRTGDVPRTSDAAAGRSAPAEASEREATGRTGSGAVRHLSVSTQDAEVLLRAIRDDPARVLDARLRSIHRLRQERGQ